MTASLDNIPVLWAAFNPRTSAFFIDEHEKYVREMASAVLGATVIRIDVPALLRVARAARRDRDIRRSAAYAGRDIYQAWEATREELDAAQELDAALAALDTPTDPTS